MNAAFMHQQQLAERRLRYACVKADLRLHKLGIDEYTNEPIYDLQFRGSSLSPKRPMDASEVWDEVRARLA